MLRAAVVGTGYLGRFHAQKYATLPGVSLEAVVDINPDNAQAVADELGTSALADHRALQGKVDLASVVVPTSEHFAVTRDLLEAGIHVLLEKPMASTVAEAQQLIELAAKNNLILQVGHLERFNPIMQHLTEAIDRPLFIESHRVAPFRPRGTDTNVVLDLMIHDIDLIMNMVGAPITHIDASGAAVLTREIDIANVRLHFASGCVANVTASRISDKIERRMRIFQYHSYLSVDLNKGTVDVRRVADSGEMYPGIADISHEHVTVATGDALLAEVSAFVSSVRDNTPPLVSGSDGMQVLQAAIEITRQLEQRAPLIKGAPPQFQSNRRRPS